MHLGLRIALLGLIPAPLAIIQMTQTAPPVLINTSASEPPGVYVRTSAVPAVGRIIAFRPPAGAYPYVAEAMPERARTSILKTVRAGAGDWVCADHHQLAVNGRTWAGIAAVDRLGRPLPQWRDCRRLAGGEFFVFSTRIPNSFDSRYYGPVRRADVLGVYRPLWPLPRAS